MTIDQSNNKIVNCRAWRLFCARLLTTNYDKPSLRSKSVDISSDTDFYQTMIITEDIKIEIDEVAETRGHWNNRFEFLLSCIGFAVGMGNVWRFPIRVYESGGGAFLIPYVILCIALGIPLLLLELGLAQFSGRGPTNAFKLVPVMYCIGWSMVIISLYIVTYYSTIIAWSYFYLFGSLSSTMPWTICSHYFNSENCLESKEKLSNKSNGTIRFVSSTTEYWDYYVTGFIKYPSREFYTMNESPGKPQWHLVLCLLLTWIVVGFSLMCGVKVSGKMMYFLVFYPYAALFALFCLGCTLPGAVSGIKFYLSPDWKRIIEPKILRAAIEQVFFSCSIAVGGMLTYASYNNFNDNIYRDGIVIILVDFFTSVLSGFAVFPILGYIAQRTGMSISKVVRSGSSLFFISFTEALATLPAPQFWTILLMLMAISLGMDSQFAMFETIIAGFVDVFPFLRRTPYSRIIFVWVMIFICFLLGIIFVTPGGKYYFEIIDGRVVSFGLPCIALVETVSVGLIYGFRQLRYDFRMMTGYSLNWYWFIMMAFICPIVIILILISSLLNNNEMLVYGIPIPYWGEILATFLIIILISPIFIGMIHVVVKYYKKYPNLKGIEFIKVLFAPPIYWGPRHKKDWLLGRFYRDKLLKFKDDPEFIRHISNIEEFQFALSLAENHRNIRE